jgi:hypothetical protein
MTAVDVETIMIEMVDRRAEELIAEMCEHEGAGDPETVSQRPGRLLGSCGLHIPPEAQEVPPHAITERAAEESTALSVGAPGT